MMQAYRHGSHTVYQCHYHFVFIPKYRKPVLRGEVGLHLRELIREICKAHDIEILQGHIRPDHVHLLLSVPPTLSNRCTWSGRMCPCRISMSCALQISRISSRKCNPTSPRRTGLRYFGMNTKW